MFRYLVSRCGTSYLGVVPRTRRYIPRTLVWYLVQRLGTSYFGSVPCTMRCGTLHERISYQALCTSYLAVVRYLLLRCGILHYAVWYLALCGVVPRTMRCGTLHYAVWYLVPCCVVPCTMRYVTLYFGMVSYSSVRYLVPSDMVPGTLMWYLVSGCVVPDVNT